MTMKSIKRLLLAGLCAAGLFTALGAHAQEAAIRKNLAERMPQVGKIDEVTRTPIPGLFEIRVGFDVFYTDAEGNYLISGQLLDTRQTVSYTHLTLPTNREV